jgi:hypothetical protein
MSLVFKKKASKVEDWISRDEACKLLGIKPSTLSVYLCSGKIPDKYVSTAVTGSKFFYKPGLLGFDN